MSVLKALCDDRTGVAVVVEFMFVNMGMISVGVAEFDNEVSVLKIFSTFIIHLNRCVYFN